MADKSECLPFVEQTNHISANNFVDSFSCDIFSQCNGVNYVVEGDKHPLRADDSKQTISKSDH